MIKKYVTFDGTGALTGAYIQEVAEGHEDNHIEVGNPEIFANWTAYRYNEAATMLELAPVPETPLATLKAALLVKIDADADAIYAAVTGNRATEYQQAYADAVAYQAAGYTGTVPSYVQSWATAKAQTATWAADDILATAAAWNAAQSAIRANRLLRKEGARAAANTTALGTVKAQWSGFVSVIHGQLGLPA